MSRASIFVLLQEQAHAMKIRCGVRRRTRFKRGRGLGQFPAPTLACVSLRERGHKPCVRMGTMPAFQRVLCAIVCGTAEVRYPIAQFGNLSLLRSCERCLWLRVCRD